MRLRANLNYYTPEITHFGNIKFRNYDFGNGCLKLEMILKKDV